jgi:ABC-type nitrate/sulfonate/bicarbonate transport system permease component
MDLIVAAMATMGLMGFIADKLLLGAGRLLLKWTEGLVAR